MHGVYKYEVDGKVVYVGKTDSNFEARIACHRREEAFAPYLSKAKIFVREMKDAREADFLETLLINQHKPELNKAKKNVTDFEVWASLDWEPWEKYRPAKRKTEKKKRCACAFYLSQDVYEELTRRAKESGVSRSRYLNDLLDRVLFNEEI